MYKKAVPTSQRTNSVSTIKVKQVMMFIDAVGSDCENIAKKINISIFMRSTEF
jgi:hypothetical protein